MHEYDFFLHSKYSLCCTLCFRLTLCTEYCPVNNRGKAGFYLCYFWSIGTCLVILLSWLVMEYLNSWRHLIAFLALPSLIVIISLK
ncbi:putative transporter, partial [Nephila pilipes]